METLVAVARHRNYGRRSKGRISDGFIASSSSGFRGINCRTFHSGVCILPAHSYGLDSLASHGPRKPQQWPFSPEPSKQPRRSNPISISPRMLKKGPLVNDESFDSEHWAGPAYSNSPPPSSLPIPKFSLRQKRSASLELHISKFKVVSETLSRSAPSSPVRELCCSPNDLFFDIDSATQNLRRLLHLDTADD